MPLQFCSRNFTHDRERSLGFSPSDGPRKLPALRPTRPVPMTSSVACVLSQGAAPRLLFRRARTAGRNFFVAAYLGVAGRVLLPRLIPTATIDLSQGAAFFLRFDGRSEPVRLFPTADLLRPMAGNVTFTLYDNNMHVLATSQRSAQARVFSINPVQGPVVLPEGIGDIRPVSVRNVGSNAPAPAPVWRKSRQLHGCQRRTKSSSARRNVLVVLSNSLNPRRAPARFPPVGQLCCALSHN